MLMICLTRARKGQVAFLPLRIATSLPPPKLPFERARTLQEQMSRRPVLTQIFGGSEPLLWVISILSESIARKAGSYRVQCLLWVISELSDSIARKAGSYKAECPLRVMSRL